MRSFRSDSFVGFFGGLDFKAVCVLGILVYVYFSFFGKRTGN